MAPRRKRQKKQQQKDKSISDPEPRYLTRSYVRAMKASGIEYIGVYFGSLPPEMLQLLLSYLDAPALSCLGATCRLLYNQTEVLWKKLCQRLGLIHNPTILCVANPSDPDSQYLYDKAVEHCTDENKRWKLVAKRNWLYSRWQCVVCYRSCSQRVDSHFDVTLCDTCHPMFYRRKCHAKEQFSLTERDLRALDNESYEFLVSDLITIARAKYGSKTALEERLYEKQKLKTRREAEKQCGLVRREREVCMALEDLNSSYSEISAVDARCMPYVSSSGSYHYAPPQQSAEDAAKWLMAWKNRQETRHKLLMAEISARASRCKGCRARYDHRLLRIPATSCTHISQETALKTIAEIKENFSMDITHYSKHGQLYLEVGSFDLEHRSAQELFMRNERRTKLREELHSRRDEWPDILKGRKEPMNCGYAHDFIYKGVATLDSEGSKCRLRQARDVARIIIAQARGWDRRYNAVKNELALKGFFVPFDKLKLESHLLMDDFVDSMIVVRGDHIVACSAAEVADKIAVIEGLEKEQKTAAAQRCARIYVECSPKPDIEGQKKERRNNLLKCLPLKSANQIGSELWWTPAQEYINCGTTTSLFGYKITTAEATASLIRLKQQTRVQGEHHPESSTTSS